MKVMIRMSLVFIFSVFMMAACSEGGAGSDAQTPVSLSMKIPEVSQASKAFEPTSEGVFSVRVQIRTRAGSLAGEVTQNVIPRSEVHIDFSVAPGNDLTFIVEAFSNPNAGGVVLFRGQQTRNIVPGPKVTLQIDLERVTDRISPREAIVPKGQTQAFALSGIAPSDVDWKVNGVQNGNEILGTVSAEGLYRAPLLIPTDKPNTPLGVPLPVNVEAVLKADPTQKEMARVKVMTGSTLKFEAHQQITPKNTGTSSTWTRSSGQRNIAYFQGNAYAVWERDQQIYFSETQTGTNGLWTPPVPVTRFEDESHAAIAAGPDGSLFVVIQQGCINCTSTGSSSRILLLVRKPGQDEFIPLPLGDLDDPDQTGLSSQYPAVAVSPDGKTVYVVWSAEGVSTKSDILFQRVNPAGTGALIDLLPRPVAESPQAESQPAIAVSKEGNVFLAWVNQGGTNSHAIWATVSTDGGKDFLPAAQVNEGTGFDQRPSVAAGLPGTVHISWEKDTCDDSCYQVAFDKGVLGPNGLIFGADQFVKSGFNSERYRQENPSIAWDGAQGVYIALSEVGFDSVRKSGIFLTKSVDNGQAFGALQSIDDDDDPKTADKDFASIAVDESGRAFAVWTDTRGGTSPNYVWFAQGE